MKKKKEEDVNKMNMSADELLRKNLEIAEENQKMLRYIKRFVIWGQIWGVIKLLIIVVPIILGILYLPSFLDNWLNEYKGLFFENQTEKLLENQVQNGGGLEGTSYSVEDLLK